MPRGIKTAAPAGTIWREISAMFFGKMHSERSRIPCILRGGAMGIKFVCTKQKENKRRGNGYTTAFITADTVNTLSFRQAATLKAAMAQKKSMPSGKP